jgi:hypothetical protein
MFAVPALLIEIAGRELGDVRSTAGRLSIIALISWPASGPAEGTGGKSFYESFLDLRPALRNLLAGPLVRPSNFHARELAIRPSN